MSSGEPAPGGNDAASRRSNVYFCRSCDIIFRVNPVAIPVCSRCGLVLLHESDMPSSSSSRTIDAPPFGPDPMIRPNPVIRDSSSRTIDAPPFGPDPMIRPNPVIRPGAVVRQESHQVIDIEDAHLLFQTNSSRPLIRPNHDPIRPNPIVIRPGPFVRLYRDQLIDDSSLPLHSPQKSDTLPEVNITSDDGLQCPICLENLMTGEVATELPCKHLYHKACIANWLKKGNTCPMCRSKIMRRPHNSQP